MLVWGLVACQGTPTPTPTLEPTVTMVAAAVTPTFTFTPSPTPTTTPRPTATNTAIPTLTPTPSPTIPVVGVGTPVHRSQAVIGPENVTQLTELARWGRGVINDVAYSADGNWIAVGTSRGIYVHDVRDFQAEPQHIEITGGADKVAISPDGGLVAAALPNHLVQLWRLTDRTLLYSLPTQAASLEFSPNGQLLSTGGQLWQVSNGQLFRSVPDAFGTVFSPSGQTVVIWSYVTLSIYRLSDNVLLSERKPVLLSTDEEELGAVFATASFLDDENFVITVLASTPNDFTGLVELQRGNQEELLFTIDRIPFSHWHISPLCNEPLVDADPPPPPIPWEMEIASEEQIVALFYTTPKVFGDLHIHNMIRFFGLADQQPLYTIEDGFIDMAFAPDEQKWVSATQDGHLQIRQVSDGKILENFVGYNEPVLNAIISPENQFVAVEHLDSVTIRRLNDGETLFQYSATQVAFAPDGDTFALGYSDGRIEIHAVQDGTLEKTVVGHTDGITGLTFTPSGKALVSSGLDCQLFVWQMPDGLNGGQLENLMIKGYTSQELKPVRVWNLVPVINHDFLVGEYAGSMGLWNINSGALINNPQTNNYLEGVGVSFDGAYLALAGRPIRLLTLQADGQVTEVWADGNATCVSFSPDSQLLVAGLDENYVDAQRIPDLSRNGSLQLWDVENGQMLHTLSPGTHKATTIAFTSDGRFLVSGSIDGVVRVWGVP